MPSPTSSNLAPLTGGNIAVPHTIGRQVAGRRPARSPPQPRAEAPAPAGASARPTTRPGAGSVSAARDRRHADRGELHVLELREPAHRDRAHDGAIHYDRDAAAPADVARSP